MAVVTGLAVEAHHSMGLARIAAVRVSGPSAKRFADVSQISEIQSSSVTSQAATLIEVTFNAPPNG